MKQQNKNRLPLHSRVALIFSLLIFLLPSCSVEPELLDFGKDTCSFCKMTVIDKKFGGELLNSKGKVLKFDSGECMLRYLKSNKDFKVTKYLVVTYDNPGILMDAEKARYLAGGNVNSPMGGKLAAFTNHEAAEKFQKELKGDLILWDKVQGLNF